MLGKKRTNEKSLFKSECFLSKLYDILDDNNNKNIIHWDAEGKKIIIKDIISFCNIILPKYYKHKNYSSFIRQLNLYGFHKNKGTIKNIEEYETTSNKQIHFPGGHDAAGHDAHRHHGVGNDYGQRHQCRPVCHQHRERLEHSRHHAAVLLQ
jgi:hypothetical protein